MLLVDLFKEVFSEYRKKWWKSRMEKPWTENLFFIPLVLAIIVLLIIIFQTFIFPGKPMLDL
jgi:hypothetical protein